MKSELVSKRIILDDSYEAIEDYLTRNGRSDEVPAVLKKV